MYEDNEDTQPSSTNRDNGDRFGKIQELLDAMKAEPARTRKDMLRAWLPDNVEYLKFLGRAADSHTQAMRLMEAGIAPVLYLTALRKYLALEEWFRFPNLYI